MLKVYVGWGDYGNTLEIAFIDERGDEIFIAKPMKLEFKKVSEGEHWEPTLQLHRRIADQFLQAMAESLDKEGVKTDKDAKIEGTLEATRYHLEDLRKLLKLKA